MEADVSSRLKQVLRYLPASVGIVTSYSLDGDEPVGLAMSAVMPMSLEPCSMAISINRSGSSYPSMISAGEFCLNLLDTDTYQFLEPFVGSRLREQRFGCDWQKHGKLWYIPNAPANIFCKIEKVVSYGTHDLVIGRVVELLTRPSSDLLCWADGSLGRFSRLQ